MEQRINYYFPPPSPSSIRRSSRNDLLIGDYAFDPLGFSTPENIDRMRIAEVKHGRLAMLAAWGWPVGTFGFALLTKLQPPDQVCTGNGCYLDTIFQDRALSLSQIATISDIYWIGFFMLTTIVELLQRKQQDGNYVLKQQEEQQREKAASVVGVTNQTTMTITNNTSFSSLRSVGAQSLCFLAERQQDEAIINSKNNYSSSLKLSEIQHGRLAMMAMAVIWIQSFMEVASKNNKANMITIGHQLWGETCIINIGSSSTVSPSVCYEQTTATFDFVLSWEILFRVITGYNAEPYF